MLLIDVGNTSIVLAASSGLHQDVDLVETHTLPSDPSTELELLARIETLLPHAGTSRVAVSSVVPRITDRLRDGLPGCFIVDHETAFPFDLAVADPAAIGADRYCNMAAAVAEGWTTALVVDAGTATTFDVLHGGVFVGGLIAPGIALAAEALGARAARLPTVAAQPRPAKPAPDTEGAMAAGAFQVGVRGVLGTLEALRLELDGPPVVLTGGLAPMLVAPQAEGSGNWRLDPLWSLRGLSRLVEMV